MRGSLRVWALLFLIVALLVAGAPIAPVTATTVRPPPTVAATRAAAFVAPSSSTQPTMTERLTLQTSTGPSPSDPRFVVFAFPRSG